MEGAFSNSHSLEVFPKWVLDTLASLELVPVNHVIHVTHVTHFTHVTRDSICSIIASSVRFPTASGLENLVPILQLLAFSYKYTHLVCGLWWCLDNNKILKISNS